MTSPTRRIAIAQPDLGDEEYAALREPLLTGWLTQGPKVAAFEHEFAKRHGVDHAMAVTSATTGLHLALSALCIGPGDEVIVPAFTWVATANAVLYCGATPVFADVDRDTFNIDPAKLAALVTRRTRAVIVVHLFGLCVDVSSIRAMLPSDVSIVEDAACAAGGACGDTPAGALGDIAVFSFHPRKSITTGEGGMVTTSNGDLAQRVRTLRNHGASVSEEERHHGPQPYILPAFEVMGFNYRMTDLQGAVGLVQLKKLDRYIDERAQWARWYSEQLGNLAWLRMPRTPKSGRHAWQSFVTYIDPTKAPMVRNEMMARLHAKGVATRPGTHAVHMLKYYADRLNLRPDDYPGARDCDQNSMAIPLHNRMTGDDYRYVVDVLRGFN